MSWITRLFFLLCRGISVPLMALVKPRLFQFDEELADTLAAAPVCYVLRNESWIDRFLLERLLKSTSLPKLKALPRQLPEADRAACLYLPVLNALREGGMGDTGMVRLIDKASSPGYGLQIVPVAMYWGVNPGKETSFFRLLLGDGENAGALRKMLIVLAQRKNVLVELAAPVSFDDILSRRAKANGAASTLARLLSFYYSRHKTATLGPSLFSRAHIIATVLRQQSVRDVVAELAAQEGGDEAKLRKQARQMADEVAASFDERFIQFLGLVLSWVFRKIYAGLKVYHFDRLRDAANNVQLIYMPSHRSHLDYLLISYTLYTKGLVPPHIAAGVNLNFWPVGGLLRRGGAFYLRRSFNGQPLYTAIFKAYLDVILARGYPMEFFPEGGRSRTGRLLPPKKGMLSMAVDSFVRQPSRRVAFVPVYVGYDKLVESGSYVKELKGGKKKSESAGSLVEARKIFRSSYGHPHVSFGDPIYLEDSLNELEPEWRQQLREGNDGFVDDAVSQIAQQNMQRINSAAVVNPIGLLAMVLLSSPQKALAKDEMLMQMDTFLALLKNAPYAPDVVLPTGSVEEIYEQAALTAGLATVEHPWGPMVTVSGKAAVLLTYYRNSVMHVLALPSLIARFFRHSDSVLEKDLIEACVLLYPFLKRELFLAVADDECEAAVATQIENLVTQNLLQREGDRLLRPAVGSDNYAVLIGLGRILRETFERYTVTSLMLVKNASEQPMSRKEVERQIVEMVQRLAILIGREAPEYFDKNMFRVYLDTLIAQQLLDSEERDGEAFVHVTERLSALSQRWVALLGPDVQQNMQQLIGKGG